MSTPRPRRAREVLPEEGAEDDGERSGTLQDERGETGRHTRRHAPVEEGELQDAETQPVEQDPAPGHVRPGHEEDGGDRQRRPPEGDGEERRELLERRVDGDEVHAPEDGDEHGEETVASGHGSSVTGIHCFGLLNVSCPSP